ncbi:hypothetical protein CBR_g24207 [Chara braunii]|uniref:Uncharacterized protein n=1 Tax=Chara braunii TaxID=69332 RepID=A0A388L629_CHABU|nr:hypothetical protein CBR_g24207 [Chara braunii]|eukprot:GBG77759.1 hypothetical protein CBR_g24207 [Chara braunii]
MEKEGAGGSRRGLVMGVEESIVVKHAREEASKGHVELVGEGGCKVFVAYSLDVGDERKVGNDGGGEVMAEGEDVLDEVVRGSEKVGPLEEGVTRSSGGAAVVDFGHPPFGDIGEEAGGDNGKPVDKGHVVEENILMGKAGEGHDVGGSEGTGDFPFAGNDPGEGVEVEVIRGGVVAGVIELAVVIKEVVGGKLWHCGVNPGGDLGIGGTKGGDGGGRHDGLGNGGVLDASDEGGGGGSETVVDDEDGGRVEEEGLGDMVVEVVGVEEVRGGVLLEAAVEEGVVCAVEEGGATMVTTVMEGLFPSSVVTLSDMVAFMSLREAMTEVWRVLSVWRMAERSGVAVFAGGCSPASLRAMLSTESTC